MRRFKLLISAVVFSALAIGLFLQPPAKSQVPSANPPFNIDTGAIITLALNGPGNLTTTSANQTNLDKTGIVCTYVQTASSGSASTTFEIDSFDAASATWNRLVISSAIATPVSGAPYTLVMHPGLIAADVPTNGVGKSMPLPRVWRAQTITGGTNSVVATVGCNVIK